MNSNNHQFYKNEKLVWIVIKLKGLPEHKYKINDILFNFLYNKFKNIFFTIWYYVDLNDVTYYLIAILSKKSKGIYQIKS